MDPISLLAAAASGDKGPSDNSDVAALRERITIETDIEGITGILWMHILYYKYVIFIFVIICAV